MLAFCVTLSPAMMSFTPLSNTIFAASGSTKKLNSARLVTFPLVIEPPIMLICSIFSLSSGKVLRSSAIFVSGPTAMIVIFSGDFWIISCIIVTEFSLESSPTSSDSIIFLNPAIPSSP